MHNTIAKYRPVAIYSLDVIISVGYRVHSLQGVAFRRWATGVLKQYMLRGYAMNQRLNDIEERLTEQGKMLEEHQEKIDFFVRTSLPPVQGVFFEGQVFDARVFVEDLVRSARREVILIDGYVDARTFDILEKRAEGVNAVIYTEKVGRELQEVKAVHDAQYVGREIELREYGGKFHDRFLIVDDDLYHIGASVKDLGKRLFAFDRMGIDKDVILSQL